MAIEIERKFLVRSDAWRHDADAGVRLRQGYLSRVTGTEAVRSSIRVRIGGGQATLNIKGATLGIRRDEYEYAIPLADAEAMLTDLCLGAVIDKTRYHVEAGPHVWEIDVFAGENAGLVVAEIELNDEAEAFPHPDWLGQEVSADPRYYNVCLAERPFSRW
ncbi:MAG: CYTH domain-containing protein [Gammaproteobacteria bacterium]